MFSIKIKIKKLNMKSKLLKLILFVMITSGVMLLMQSCGNGDDSYLFGTTTNTQVSKSFLLTRYSHPDLFTEKDGIKVDLVRELYPNANFVFTVAFRVGDTKDIPVGMCIDNGLLINRLVSDKLGLLHMDSYGTIDIMNYSNFILSDFEIGNNQYESVVQMQMLIDDSNVIAFENDVEEEHFILVTDTNNNTFVKYFRDQKLSDIVKALNNSDTKFALKLGGGSINGGYAFNNESVIKIGDVEADSPNLIAILVLE